MTAHPGHSGRNLLAWLFGCWLLALTLPALAATPGPVDHGPRDQQRVALIFDFCQKPGHPAEVRRPATVPFLELGSHSWSHPDFPRLDATAITSQLDRTQDEMQSMAGRTPALFRSPTAPGTSTPCSW